MIERVGHPDQLPRVNLSLIEEAAFGERARQVRTRRDGRRHQEAEPLTGRLAVERLHDLTADIFGRAVVA